MNNKDSLNYLSDIEQSNLLQDIISYAKIGNIDEVLENIKSMKNKEILKQHKYSITQNKDGRYSTYIIPDEENAPSKRKKIVKATREELENALLSFYKKKQGKDITVRMLYPEWLDFKSLHTDSTAYIKTIDELWIKFYLDNPIIDIPVKNLDKYQLDIWAHTLVKENNMTKKKYYNVTVIMRQALEYAVDRNIILQNPLKNVHIDTKLFRRPKKKPDYTQVFLEDEQKKIENEAYEDFKKTFSTSCLAIPFAFQTGMRISEIVGLKWSDINDEQDNCIHVQRMEVVQYSKLPDGTWSNPSRNIVERTKSDVGNRNIYLTTTARNILKEIWNCNSEKNYSNSEYIFLNDNKRIHTPALDSRIRKYCNHINISEKGMHKIRKTYVSTLIDCDNININYIRAQVGHADERTTYGNYVFNRKSEDLTEHEMEKALVR